VHIITVRTLQRAVLAANCQDDLTSWFADALVAD
jgi:hypothetical protein